jgi:hypothetical protein
MRQVTCMSLHSGPTNPETNHTEDKDNGPTDDKN